MSSILGVSKYGLYKYSVLREFEGRSFFIIVTLGVTGSRQAMNIINSAFHKNIHCLIVS